MQVMTQQNPKHRAQWRTIDPMVIAWSLTIALSLVIVWYGIWAGVTALVWLPAPPFINHGCLDLSLMTQVAPS
jgi:hypothetical protein